MLDLLRKETPVERSAPCEKMVKAAQRNCGVHDGVGNQTERLKGSNRVLALPTSHLSNSAELKKVKSSEKCKGSVSYSIFRSPEAAFMNPLSSCISSALKDSLRADPRRRKEPRKNELRRLDFLR